MNVTGSPSDPSRAVTPAPVPTPAPTPAPAPLRGEGAPERVLKHQYSLGNTGEGGISFASGAASNPIQMAFSRIDSRSPSPGEAPASEQEEFEAACKYAQRKENSARAKGGLEEQEPGTAGPTTKKHRSENLQDKLNQMSSAVRRLFTGKDKGGNLIDIPRAAILAGTGGGIGYAKYVVGGQVKAHVGDGAANIVGMAGGLAALPLGVVDGVSAGGDVVNFLGNKHQAVRQMVLHREAAMRHFENPEQSTPADKKAFLLFMAAKQKIPALNESARKDKLRTYLGAARSSAGLGPGAACSNASAIAKATSGISAIANAALNVVGSVYSIFSGAVQIYQGQGERSRATQQRVAAKAKEQRVEGYFAPDSGAVQKNKTLAKIKGTLSSNLERISRHGKREQGFALSKIAKGVFDISAGVTGAVFAIGAVAGMATLTLATGGIALAAVATVVSTVYLGVMLSKMYMKWKSDHQAKDRQRQAQELIDKCNGNPQILQHYFDNAQHASLEIIGKGGKLEHKMVDVATNEYIALHLLAARMAKLGSQMEAGDVQEVALVIEFLHALGMSEHELHAMAGIVLEIALPSEREEFIKKAIAPAFGMTYRSGLKSYAQKNAQTTSFKEVPDTPHDKATGSDGGYIPA